MPVSEGIWPEVERRKADLGDEGENVRKEASFLRLTVKMLAQTAGRTGLEAIDGNEAGKNERADERKMGRPCKKTRREKNISIHAPAWGATV